MEKGMWLAGRGKMLLAVSLLLMIGSTPVVERPGISLLRVESGNIVDAAGRTVILRGLNVEFKDFRTVLGERDVRRISGLGANVIRLVMDYRDFETSPYQYSFTSLSLLDRIIDWCERYGIYIILDMHLAPGMQNVHDFVVHREKEALFWQEEHYQERFYALWEEIAGRYAGRAIVAGYDILNEGAPQSSTQYQTVLERAANKIRRRDKNHMLIVEEAILPEWRKELVLISDPNVLYSIHFFHPPRFTFYATTTDRPITAYPGEMAHAGEMISQDRINIPGGTGEWQRLELRAVPPAGAEVLLVRIAAAKSSGSVWIDDIRLTVDGSDTELPAPLVANNSFEIDYPGFSWSVEGSCVSTDKSVARSGRSSLVLSGCKGNAYAESSPIPVSQGEYVLTGWYKSEGAAGERNLSLCWHTRRVVGTIDRSALIEKMKYAVEFKTGRVVPVYVGEFTAHANPSEKSVRQYLDDLLSIMRKEGFHWTFWEYYSVYRGVGLYTGNSPYLVNPAALDMLADHMKK